MKIASSSLTLDATHQATRSDKRSERLFAWVGDRRPPDPSERSALEVSRPAAPAPAPTLAPTLRPRPDDTSGDPGDWENLPLTRDLLDALLVARMVDRDGGRDMARAMRGMADLQEAGNAPAPAATNPQNQGVSGEAPPASAGFGVEYDLHEEHRESEATEFRAAGTVTTAEGRTIDLTVALDMARAEVQIRDVSIRLGDAKKVDPLVLNLNGGAATFEGTHGFDLDADGRSENIARLAGGAAYLALDQNGNGRVDDGRELFGPQSGDGFAELARRDDDGNGWIDVTDAVYQQLALWSPASGGAPSALVTLARAGIGAIYLGNVATPFTVKADGTAAVAEIAKTGIFLREDGTPGTVQHVDLLV